MSVKVVTQVTIGGRVEDYRRRSESLEKYLNDGYKVESNQLLTQSGSIVFVDTFTKETTPEED